MKTKAWKEKILNNVKQWRIQAIWETGIPVWVSKLWHPKSTFQVLLFQLYFNKKYVEVAINDFTMYLIISRWFRRQKCRWNRKTIDKKRLQQKKKLSIKVFSFIWIRNRSRECSIFLLHKYFTLLHMISSVYLLHLFRSDRFAALTSL